MSMWKTIERIEWLHTNSDGPRVESDFVSNVLLMKCSTHMLNVNTSVWHFDDASDRLAAHTGYYVTVGGVCFAVLFCLLLLILGFDESSEAVVMRFLGRGNGKVCL